MGVKKNKKNVSKKKVEKKVEKKDFTLEYEEVLLNKVCFICSKTMEKKEADEGNYPVRMPNVGYMHRRCRGVCTVNLIENPVKTDNLHGQMNDMLGKY